jgi:hypothetical protein
MPCASPEYSIRSSLHHRVALCRVRVCVCRVCVCVACARVSVSSRRGTRVGWLLQWYRVRRRAVMGARPPCWPKVKIGVSSFSSVRPTPHNCQRARANVKQHTAHAHAHASPHTHHRTRITAHASPHTHHRTRITAHASPHTHTHHHTRTTAHAPPHTPHVIVKRKREGAEP